MSRRSQATHRPKPKSTLRLHLAMLSRRAGGDQDGTTAIEYALIASGIGAAVAVTVWTLGTTTAGLYQRVLDAF